MPSLESTTRIRDGFREVAERKLLLDLPEAEWEQYNQLAASANGSEVPLEALQQLTKRLQQLAKRTCEDKAPYSGPRFLHELLAGSKPYIAPPPPKPKVNKNNNRHPSCWRTFLLITLIFCLFVFRILSLRNGCKRLELNTKTNSTSKW
jgi:hypothetical protein